MTIQIALRLPDEMVKEVDQLVQDGRYENRTEAVRAALQRLLDDLREQQLDAAIVAGYRRIPDTPVDAWVQAATEALVKEEPW
jgi:putative addiction module CopG family antidote